MVMYVSNGNHCRTLHLSVVPSVQKYAFPTVSVHTHTRLFFPRAFAEYSSHIFVCLPLLSALQTAGQLTSQRGWISISSYWHSAACLLTATSPPQGSSVAKTRVSSPGPSAGRSQREGAGSGSGSQWASLFSWHRCTADLKRPVFLWPPPHEPTGNF